MYRKKSSILWPNRTRRVSVYAILHCIVVLCVTWRERKLDPFAAWCRNHIVYSLDSTQ